MPQARRRAQAAASDRKVTKRMVLEQSPVLVLPAAVPDEKLIELQKVCGEILGEQPVFTRTWAECGIFEGDQRTAINAFAGKPGTAEARVGVFKAPALTSWKGGVRNVAPPVPLVQQESLDDLLPERSDA